MISLNDKRWFMGKGRPIQRTEIFDCIPVAQNKLSIVKVYFDDIESNFNLYAIIEDEKKFGYLLQEGFCQKEIPGTKGKFIFKSLVPFKEQSVALLDKIAPTTTEQSNSSFVLPSHFFFKLYRRLQEGLHPEPMILESLNKAFFNGAPQILGLCQYQTENQIYTLGILEEHYESAVDCWSLFCKKMKLGGPSLEDVVVKSRALGNQTAQMHLALQNLGRSPIETAEEPPLDKLQSLLEKHLKTQQEKNPWAIELHNHINILKNKFHFPPPLLLPQTIHGDFHLGQILWIQNQFKIIDFEGEPARTLEFRRRLRSPLVDLAGMLRSLQYASAVSGQNSTAAENAFLEGYAESIGNLTADALKPATKPYIFAKAVYEACYELEFRPQWLHIPAKALLTVCG
ncbi:MAG: aminoglycoside phosphotransferase [Fibrobacteraceae bacterium]|nr:aminoglycoside phosphotransferase [Fibrobacteraceae bacterium]